MSEVHDQPRAFLALDLDNVHLGALGFQGTQDLRDRLHETLETIQKLVGWRIEEGYASMNQETRREIHPDVSNILNKWKIRVEVVETLEEEADKHIFFALARASHLHERFIIVSKDAGFAKAAELVRDANPAALFAVVFDRETGNLRDLYGRITDAVQFIEFNPRGQASPRARKAVPDVEPGYILVCKLCGWRSMRPVTVRFPQCRHCAGPMITTGGGNVVPTGTVPFKDGPILEVWFKGRRLRTAVLCTQSTTFGQAFDLSDPWGHIGLSDLVVDGNRISRRQFTVSRREDNFELENVGSRRMFTADLRPIQPAEPLELTDGLEFYLNDPRNPSDTGALLKFIYREPVDKKL